MIECQLDEEHRTTITVAGINCTESFDECVSESEVSVSTEYDADITGDYVDYDVYNGSDVSDKNYSMSTRMYTTDTLAHNDNINSTNNYLMMVKKFMK